MAGLLGALVFIACLNPADAQELELRPTSFSQLDWPTLNFFGQPGLIDMPEGRSLPDGEIGVTISNFTGTTRYSLIAQVHPRIAGTFRYVAIQDYNAAGFSTFFDRSFDLRFTVLRENRTFPEVTVGLQDFVGTGVYSAEYLVATKSLTRRLHLTGGLGWGRLAGGGPLPGFSERPELTPDITDEGGETNLDTLFRGDIGFFGGISWRPREDIILKAEYSSDRYELEDDELGIFDRRSPFNIGAEYQPQPGTQLGLYYLYGSQLGLRLSLTLNPRRPAASGSLDPAPPTIVPRPSRESAPEIYATAWTQNPATRRSVRDRIDEALGEERLRLEGLRLSGSSAQVYVANLGYQAPAQAIGRSARVAARLLPSSIETITIVPMAEGLPLPGHTFRRTDLERFEIDLDGSERILAARAVGTAALPPRDEGRPEGLYPRFRWRIGPYVRTSLFDPVNPLRADFGIAVGATMRLVPGLSASGTVRKRVIGNLDDNNRESDSVLPRVRTDFPTYDREGDPEINRLTLDYYLRAGRDIYTRFSAGYFETMFGGVSSEVLWAPYERRYAVGVELNYVRQRDFDGGLGFQEYDVTTGHASLYWRFTDDFFAQVDAGQYLAGDRGATFTLDRVFPNGWRVGAFATFTDVSAEEFGEGSFDKGIRLDIPLGWFLGRSSTATQPLTIRPVQRDGGARLIVQGRLYDTVQEGLSPRVEEQWGRFWR